MHMSTRRTLETRIQERLGLLKAEQARLERELAKVPQLQAQAHAVAGAIGELEPLVQAEPEAEAQA